MIDARMIGLLVWTCLSGVASPAFAEPTALTEKLADFKAASQQLKELYETSGAIAMQLDAALKNQQPAPQDLEELHQKSKAIAEEIDAAAKNQQDAEAALTDAIQGVDPESEQDGKLVGEAYAEVAAAHESISAAELQADNSEAVVDEDAHEAEEQ